MSIVAKLKEMRDFSGLRDTVGLTDATLESLSRDFPELVTAVNKAHELWSCFKLEYPTWFKMKEAELVAFLQEQYVNFYKEDAINPYVALAALGPWLVTTHGAVMHDNGGYGMLGFGQSPKKVLGAMKKFVEDISDFKKDIIPFTRRH